MNTCERHLKWSNGNIILPPFSRNMEDFVTWVDTSKIKQHVMNYNDEVCFLLSHALQLLHFISNVGSVMKAVACHEPSFWAKAGFSFAEGWLWSSDIILSSYRPFVTPEGQTGTQTLLLLNCGANNFKRTDQVCARTPIHWFKTKS